MEFCVPGIMNIADISDVVALVAPTSLYLSATDQDRWSRGAQQIFDEAKPHFPADRLQLKIWPGGHAFTRPMRDAAYQFLERQLT
jgi:hypothetical protein